GGYDALLARLFPAAARRAAVRQAAPGAPEPGPDALRLAARRRPRPLRRQQPLRRPADGPAHPSDGARARAAVGRAARRTGISAYRRVLEAPYLGQAWRNVDATESRPRHACW